MEIERNELYGIRTLVFQEIAPQSNKYNQVLLSPEEFKKMAFSLGTPTGEKEGDIDIVSINFSEEEYDLPDLKEIDA